MFSEGENTDTSTCQYYYFVGKFHQFPSVIFLSRSILDALQDALSHSDAVTHSQLAPTSVKTLSSLTTACSTGIFSYVFCTSFSQYFFFSPQIIYFAETHPSWCDFIELSFAALAWRVLTHGYRLLGHLRINLCLAPLRDYFALPL